MKKTIIAVAVAAALVPAAAMADATVYGRIHNSIDALSGVSANSQKVHVNSNSSRFGVKGSADLGDGLTGVFQAESGISTVGGGGEDGNGGAGGTSSTGQLFTNSRDVYIGLSSADYGTLLVGRLPAANQWVYDSNLFADQIGDAATFTNAGIPGRVNGAVHYVTPKIADMLTLTATWLPASGLEAQQNTTTAPTPRASNTVGFYAAANVVGADIKVVYFDVNGSAVKPLSIAASYDLGNGAMVTGQYVSVNTQGGPTDNVFNVGGQFKFTEKDAIKAQYSDYDGNASMIAVGIDHDLSKQMQVYVAYALVNNDGSTNLRADNYGHGATTAGPALGEDPSVVSVGLTYNF